MTPKLAEYIAEGRTLSADKREIAALALQQISDAEQAESMPRGMKRSTFGWMRF